MGRFGGPEGFSGGYGERFRGSYRGGDPADERKSDVDWHEVRRVLAYLKPYKWQIALVLLSIGVGSVLSLAPPQLIRAIIDKALPQRNARLLNLLSLGSIALAVVSALLSVGRTYLITWTSQRIMLDLRAQLYERLAHMTLRFYTLTRPGDIITRLNNDVSGVQGLINVIVVTIVTNVITLVTTLIVIFAMNWQLAVLAVILVPLFVLPVRRVGRIRRALTRMMQEKRSDLNSFIHETLGISGYLLTKVFGREELQQERFTEKNLDLMELSIRQAMVGRWFFAMLGVLGAFGSAIIWWSGGHLHFRHGLSLGTIVAFTAYLGRLYGPVRSLANVRVEFVRSMAHFERLFEYIDASPEIVDGERELTSPKGSLEFSSVTFSYEPDGKPALKDVSFAAPAGRMVALVGPSGAGKTTITYLIPRLYDPSVGQVLVDGDNVREFTLTSLRRHIGMVTQETFLFHTTVRENLLFANPDATDEQLEQACRQADIHERIVALPEGYETTVGERGFKLSGGEKQRLAIARVILKQPRILILDEATSSLDSESEAQVQAALERLMVGRTSIVIAHRLSTILAADLILVLHEGRIVEQGTHAQLLQEAGLYSRLFHQQFARGLELNGISGESHRGRRRAAEN
jgi:ATP-binding cassette subfamily B protein